MCWRESVHCLEKVVMSANDRCLEHRLLLWLFRLHSVEMKTSSRGRFVSSCIECSSADSSKGHPVPKFPQNLWFDICSTVSYFIGLTSPRRFSDINLLKDLKGTSQLSTEEVKL